MLWTGRPVHHVWQGCVHITRVYTTTGFQRAVVPVLEGLFNPDSRHALRYATPWKTTCSVSGTGRKLVMNSSARSQVQSVSIPAAHRAQHSAPRQAQGCTAHIYSGAHNLPVRRSNDA